MIYKLIAGDVPIYLKFALKVTHPRHITGTAERRQILYTSRQYQFHATGWHITNRRTWFWSRDCFKILPLVVMQRDARVCQQQLSYL